MTGREMIVRQTVAVPKTASAGKYELLIGLPDLSASLRDRPEHAIRMANEGVWEPTTGLNRLTDVVRVE